ncbi:unnamed protein product [Phaedon cochleariae]|uniref:DUF4780 domain-containing protein n=1 Tax=Phaedon cochleariae TaxID=80249 RepID=A0A9N9SEE8_PHACE|nr:unnamed protein product [Phaedon cochleariae]
MDDLTPTPVSGPVEQTADNKETGKIIETPPKNKNVKRARNTYVSTRTAYSDMTRGIPVAVIDRCHPDVTLNQEQVELVQNAIVDALYAAPSGSEGVAQFERSWFSGRVLSVTCANKRSLS